MICGVLLCKMLILRGEKSIWLFCIAVSRFGGAYRELPYIHLVFLGSDLRQRRGKVVIPIENC